jgi:hypothetical protein
VASHLRSRLSSYTKTPQLAVNSWKLLAIAEGTSKADRVYLPQDYREMLSQSDRRRAPLSSSTQLKLLEVKESGKAIASTPKNL